MLLMMLPIAAGVAFKRKHSATCKDPGIATITCASGNVSAIFNFFRNYFADCAIEGSTRYAAGENIIAGWAGALNIGPFFALGLARGLHAL